MALERLVVMAYLLEYLVAKAREEFGLIDAAYCLEEGLLPKIGWHG